MVNCITNYVSDYGEPPRQWNIEPEPVEVYQALWVIEKARRIEARRAAQVQAYFEQFKGDE